MLFTATHLPIKSLVKFIRKRDPRYKEHQGQQAAEAEARAKSTAAKLKAGGQRSGSQTPKNSPAVFIAQSWQDVDQMADAPDAGDEWAAAEGASEDGAKVAFECVACRKSFRSEAAWDSHARSKKHLKEIEILRQTMLAEEEELGLRENGQGEDEDGEDGTDASSSPPTVDGDDQSECAPSLSEDITTEDDTKMSPKAPAPSEPKLEIQSIEPTPEVVVEVDPTSSTDTKPQLSKKDKRRAKEAAKKAQDPIFVSRLLRHTYLYAHPEVSVLQCLQRDLPLKNQAVHTRQNRRPCSS